MCSLSPLSLSRARAVVQIVQHGGAAGTEDDVRNRERARWLAPVEKFHPVRESGRAPAAHNIGRGWYRGCVVIARDNIQIDWIVARRCVRNRATEGGFSSRDSRLTARDNNIYNTWANRFKAKFSNSRICQIILMYLPKIWSLCSYTT